MTSGLGSATAQRALRKAAAGDLTEVAFRKLKTRKRKTPSWFSFTMLVGLDLLWCVVSQVN
jgi:hypothetical protein